MVNVIEEMHAALLTPLSLLLCFKHKVVFDANEDDTEINFNGK